MTVELKSILAGALNLNNFDADLLEHTGIRSFDGAVTWKFLD